MPKKTRITVATTTATRPIIAPKRGPSPSTSRNPREPEHVRGIEVPLQQARQLIERRDHHLRPGELGGRVRARHRHRRCSGRPAGLDAGRRVLHHQRLAGLHAQPPRRGQVALGVRLAARHVLGVDHHGGRLDAHGAQPRRRERARGRGHHRDAVLPERPERLGRAGDGAQAAHVLRLPSLDRLRLGDGVEVRPERSHHLDRSHAVHRGPELILLDAVLRRPVEPHPLGRIAGLDEHAVEVEQDGREPAH
jgi:hypothetical protein